jgi:hypothetical protein
MSATAPQTAPKTIPAVQQQSNIVPKITSTLPVAPTMVQQASRGTAGVKVAEFAQPKNVMQEIQSSNKLPLHDIVPAKDVHPAIVHAPAKPVIAPRISSVPQSPPVKVPQAPASAQQVVTARVASDPFLPTLSKVAVSPTAPPAPPIVSATPVPKPVVLPPNPKAPVVTSAPIPTPTMTHGTLPNRVDVREVGAPITTKHPLSEVFPSKQEVIDGAHDAMVKNGTLSPESGAGAEDRVTNYVDTRLEDENIFGGKNKGTSQVVWGIVQSLQADAVISGDLPSEELSRSEHVNHALHEQAYLMVRDVAKKLSLSPLPSETVQAFLMRAATLGPLF